MNLNGRHMATAVRTEIAAGKTQNGVFQETSPKTPKKPKSFPITNLRRVSAVIPVKSSPTLSSRQDVK